MKAIYEPKGRAREYGELAVNLYRGCSHGCTYCYVPAATFQSREEFAKPVPRVGVLEALKKEAPKYAGREVFMSFSCDPYQFIDVGLKYTREAIKILHDNDISVRILTKGGHRSQRDFDLLTEKDWYGVTLTAILNIDNYKTYEPMSALPYERIFFLHRAFIRGIKTWVSLEPVINPDDTLRIIENTHSFVDEYRVGKWNHSAEANKIDWKDFVYRAKGLLDRFGKKYYIKKDLEGYE
jgi:DNA repair photolyase